MTIPGEVLKLIQEIQNLRDENANLSASCVLEQRENERLRGILKELDRLLVFSVPPKMGEEIVMNEDLARAFLNLRAIFSKPEETK